MTQPTEADRARAEAIVRGAADDSRTGYADDNVYDGPVDDLIAHVAVAVAEERAKARAPFLALADEYDRHAALMRAQAESTGVPDMVLRSQAFEDAALTIRRAAGDQP